MHVLFVCTGNVCRSPLAERLTTAFAEELGISRLTAESAGTRAMVGHPMEPASVFSRWCSVIVTTRSASEAIEWVRRRAENPAGSPPSRSSALAAMGRPRR